MIETAEDLLTVIIPTWNGRDLLKHCLQSLCRQTTRPAILVVDDHSSDSTAAMIRKEFPHVGFLEAQARGGFAKAVNRGIKASTTPYIALLNNDTEADPAWVAEGLTALQTRPEYAFFASKMIQFSNRACLDSAGDCYSRTGLPYKRGFGEPAERYSESEPVLGASAGAAFYRRNLFEKVGLLDEDFVMYLEDVELSLRAQSAGLRCLYLPDAIIYHWEAASDPARRLQVEPDTRQASPKGKIPVVFKSGFYSEDRVFWITRNRWLLMILYQPARNAHYLIWGWTKSAMFHLLKAGFLGAFARGMIAGLRLTPAALRKRRQSSWSHDRRRLCEILREY